MDEPQPPSDRQRLQELLGIPERDRTDAQWDEIHELEISLAPGNRERGPDPNARRTGPMQTHQSGQRPPNPGGHPRPNGGGGQGKKQGRKFHRGPKNRPQ